MPIGDQIRAAVDAAIKAGQETRYSIAKGAGIEYRTLVRWLDEQADIRLSTVDGIGAYLGLEIRPVKAGRK